MKHVYTALLGAVACIVGSYSISFIGACMGWFYISEGSWLVRVSLVPCIVAAVVLSVTDGVRRPRLTALIVAFFAVALAGSIGAIAVQSARFGFASVNASGYLAWCWVYAAVFLPLSYPLARLLQRLIQHLSHANGKA